MVRVRGRGRVRVRVRVGVRVRLLSALSSLVPLSPRFEILSRAKRRTTRAISPTARGMAASSTCSSTSDERAKSNDADAKGSRPADEVWKHGSTAHLVRARAGARARARVRVRVRARVRVRVRVRGRASCGGRTC